MCSIFSLTYFLSILYVLRISILFQSFRLVSPPYQLHDDAYTRRRGEMSPFRKGFFPELLLRDAFLCVPGTFPPDPLRPLERFISSAPFKKNSPRERLFREFIKAGARCKLCARGAVTHSCGTLEINVRGACARAKRVTCVRTWVHACDAKDENKQGIRSYHYYDKRDIAL